MVEHDDIIRMAHEADCLDTQHYGTIWVDKLIRFAELVAAAEREACAKVCDGIDRRYINQADKCAVAIRTKGDE